MKLTRELLLEKGFKVFGSNLTYELNSEFEICCTVQGNIFKGVVGTKKYFDIQGMDKQGILFYHEDYTLKMLDGLIFGLTKKHLN